ncbi:MAG: hypothetical protein BWY95_01894 [Bacteroidetes bacterium ADurb.BinA104]|nr:MAG: hypothetical protein BWY95_01894 [Bacteroidetes bacterium ADurb.BinA104]
MIYLLHEQVYIVSAPVILVIEPFRVFPERCIIIEFEIPFRVWIKIVVYMKSVYVITGHNIGRNFTYMISVLLQRGVK